MNNLPLVSIIIPVYNSEKYLSETIRSALKQSWSSKEIIVIDDGSTDQSLAIAKKFESLNIKVLHQYKKGASAARNFGLSISKGDYIQFLDSDDLLSEDKIENQVVALSNGLNRVAVCSTTHFLNNQSPFDFVPTDYEERFIYTNDDPVDFLIRLLGGYNFNASMIQPNAWLTPLNLIKKIGNWNEQLTLDDDGEFFARIILASKGIIKTKGDNYYRKYKHTNLSSNLSAQTSLRGLESAFLSICLKKEHLFKMCQNELAQKAIFRQFTDLAIQCYMKEPQLYNRINEELSKLPKFKYHTNLGGSLINIFSSLFGWRAAKLLKRTLNR